MIATTTMISTNVNLRRGNEKESAMLRKENESTRIHYNK